MFSTLINFKCSFDRLGWRFVRVVFRIACQTISAKDLLTTRVENVLTGVDFYILKHTTTTPQFKWSRLFS